MKLDPDWFAQRQFAIQNAVAVNRIVGPSIFRLPIVSPPPDELRAVRQAHSRALEFNLTLPPFPKTTVRFVEAPPGTAAGAATRHHDGGPIEICFVAGQSTPFLRKLALHELFHVHEFATGVWFPWDESEVRAEGFAWRAMLGWAP
jgi:hypothetical protein